MSHFPVLVIGPDVDRQLAPYHEFECTGRDDEFVQNVDRIDEARQEYAAAATTRLRDQEGDLHEPWDHCFYRDPTPDELAEIGPLAGSGGNAHMSWSSRDWKDGRGYRTKIRFIPEGREEVSVPTSEVEPFAKWVEGWYGMTPLPADDAPDLAGDHKYGWVRIAPDGSVLEVIDRTNPNKKWGYHTIGGGWSGFFTLRTDSDLPRILKGKGINQVLKRDVDFDAMRAIAASEARDRWQQVHAIIDRRYVPLWKDLIGENPPAEHISKVRELYSADPVIQDLRRAGFYEIDDYLIPLDAYVARAADSAIRTFAVVKDGIWYERGKMGWFACVSDEMSEEEWSRQFAELLDSAADDDLLTIVDCHI